MVQLKTKRKKKKKFWQELTFTVETEKERIYKAKNFSSHVGKNDEKHTLTMGKYKQETKNLNEIMVLEF